MGDWDNYASIVDALNHVRKRPAYNNRWMTIDNWAKLIKKHFDTLRFDNVVLGRAVGKLLTKRYDCEKWAVNEAGFYVTKKGPNRAWCSMIDKNKLPSTAPANLKADELVAFDADVFFQVTRDSIGQKRFRDGSMNDSGTPLPKRSSKSCKPHTRRSQSTSHISVVSPAANNTSDTPLASPADIAATPTSGAGMNYQEWGYWNSPEAKSLFGLHQPEDEKENDDIREVVEQRIDKLKGAYQSPRGWRDVVEDLDSQDLYTENDIFMVRWSCRYLVRTLQIALEKMQDLKNWNWEKCCQSAIDEINEFEDWDYISNPRTIMNCHHKLRMHKECFKNKHLATANVDKSRISHFFDLFPEAKKMLQHFMRANLNELSTERVYSELHDKILPQVASKRRQELIDAGIRLANEEYGTDELLAELKIPKLSVPTIYRWMRKLGYKYEVRKKCYYVDNHEKPENKRYRKKFIRRYRKLELRMHRWIHLPLAKFNGICAENPTFEKELKSTGFRYNDTHPMNKTLEPTHIEFSVDDHETKFHEMMERVKFGGHMSVRARGMKPLICFGQDEAIMKQYLFTNKAWVTPEGIRPLTPKDDGMGVMVSAFVSREFGFGYHDRYTPDNKAKQTSGLELTEWQQATVNEYRRRPANRKYCDEEAAKMVLTQNHGNKNDLKTGKSPFVQLFDYGKNFQGYWTYEHMVIQLEDCIDVLQALHGSTYDYLFMFDHSNGHDRQKPDGLNPNKMNKSFGGVQAVMREVEITSENQLGKYNHPRKLKIGDTQYFTFQPTDEGPCWMDDQQRSNCEVDVECTSEPMVANEFKITYLKAKLTEKGLPINGNKADLQKRCQKYEIPTSEMKYKIKQGWRGKPKGSLQILWECGFIDPSIPISGRWKQYPEKGRKDADGIVIPGSALKEMIGALPDFEDEKTLLEHHAESRSLAGCQISFIRSPKCHPEIAGEGIEYDWGAIKSHYRRSKLERKRTAENFRDLVNECLRIVNFNHRKKFSGKARDYMLAYDILEAMEAAVVPEYLQGVKADPDKPKESSAHLLDSIVKGRRKRKSHRGIGKDQSWVNSVMRAMKEHEVIVVE